MDIEKETAIVNLVAELQGIPVTYQEDLIEAVYDVDQAKKERARFLARSDDFFKEMPAEMKAELIGGLEWDIAKAEKWLASTRGAITHHRVNGNWRA